MKKRILIFGAIILIPILAFGVWRLSTNKKAPVKQEVVSINNTQEKDICNKITPEELKSIFNIDYEKPSTTKASINGGLSSDTCTFKSKDELSENNIQIVIKYSKDNNSQIVNEAWEAQTANLTNKITITDIKDEALLSGNSAYILNDRYFVAITKSKLAKDQVIKLFNNQVLGS